jgi:uncharacterized Zn-binding protein involved in type VI secretion
MVQAALGIDMRLAGLAILGALLVVPSALCAQDLKGSTPGVVTGGSGNVSIGGLPAARNGDATDSGDVVAGGSKDVFINGKPVARAGDTTTGCPGK